MTTTGNNSPNKKDRHKKETEKVRKPGGSRGGPKNTKGTKKSTTPKPRKPFVKDAPENETDKGKRTNSYRGDTDKTDDTKKSATPYSRKPYVKDSSKSEDSKGRRTSSYRGDAEKTDDTKKSTTPYSRKPYVKDSSKNETDKGRRTSTYRGNSDKKDDNKKNTTPYNRTPYGKSSSTKEGSSATDKFKSDKGQGAKKPTKRRTPSVEGSMRLNKYIANAGICSRRDADILIVSGSVSVNGVPITEVGTKVNPGDKVVYDGRTLQNEKKVYLLLNKPKDFLTTTSDPQQRRTVFELIKGACPERIYPVGRLDRMTTGVLLFSNDGDMAKKLTHPKHGVRKVYHVMLDKALVKADMIKIVEGVELDDGIVDVDKISYAGEGNDKKEIGLEIHSGKNRVVRRLFEHLGYDVVKLDRMTFAGLSKKNLKRGQWRFLTDKEVSFLKMQK